MLTIAPLLQHPDMYTAEEVAKVNDTISWLEGGDEKASETHNGCLETHKYFASLSLIKDIPGETG